MANQITPPPASAGPAGSDSDAAEESKASTKSSKFLKFIGTKKIAPTHRAGSHFLITKTQLVEGGVPADKCFKDKGSGDNKVKVTEIMFGPENDHKVPVEAFYQEAVDRLLKEPDIILVEE
ncbi:hypothetical protein GJ25_gp024 [Mycobacterium phage Hawkeye]|uniref:Uncharacterized protein n=1 Tax=Mycobacterium phage Hawkeye TaxID=1458711 RepID=X2KT04_9CAUD|nr:hypothetical protein GJ25_gp024 [Mycobacterium phage Hawkeye]AHN84035.1 hypothetical protein PBI_HAWKEYE_24 [Mycobacterium phage Hawkeye]